MRKVGVLVGCYAVARGRNPGVYTQWEDCEAQVKNFSGAKYKKFLDAADAELWISENALPVVVSRSSARSAPTPTSSSNTATAPAIPARAPAASTSTSPVKLQCHNVSVRQYIRPQKPPSSRPIASASAPPPQVQTSTPSPPKLSPPVPVPNRVSVESATASREPLVVYTDGSCRGNGQAGSTAGVGVWWGKDDTRNVSERCPGDQTNNRAELIAIIRVLERAPTDRPLEIRSDSQYSIKSMTVWIRDWKARGWRKGNGTPPSNLALIQYADLLLDERRVALKQQVEFKKVLAHSGEVGNEAADRLANLGGTLPPTPEQDWEYSMEQTRARIQQIMSSTSTPAEKTSSGLRTTALGHSFTPLTPQTHVDSSTSRPLYNLPSSVVDESAVSEALIPLRQHTSSRTTDATPSVSRSQDRFSFKDLNDDSRVYGLPDVQMSKKELEVYASCLLDDEELMREALEEGVCT